METVTKNQAAPQPEGSSVCAQKAPATLGFPGALPQRRVVWMWFGAFPGVAIQVLSLSHIFKSKSGEHPESGFLISLNNGAINID